LHAANEMPREFSPIARKFALQFDVDTVWDNHWMPFLREYFSR
jgi:hypothetical protein